MKYFAEVFPEDTIYPVCATGNTPEEAFSMLRNICRDMDWNFDPRLVMFYTAEQTTLEVEVTYTIKDNP